MNLFYELNILNILRNRLETILISIRMHCITLCQRRKVYDPSLSSYFAPRKKINFQWRGAVWQMPGLLRLDEKLANYAV
jgi:transcriptional regulator of aromatic amino acid metabolism